MKWAEEEKQKLMEMLSDGVMYRRIARELGRTENAIRVKVYELGISDTRRTASKNAERANIGLKRYDEGESARRQGNPCIAPGRLSAVDRAWWLAGWHDRDMELGYSVLGGVV